MEQRKEVMFTSSEKDFEERATNFMNEAMAAMREFIDEETPSAIVCGMQFSDGMRLVLAGDIRSTEGLTALICTKVLQKHFEADDMKKADKETREAGAANAPEADPQPVQVSEAQSHAQQGAGGE